MKGSTLWTVAVMAGAAALGAIAYRTLGTADPAAARARQASALAPATPAPATNQTAAMGNGPRISAQGFRLAPPSSQPDDVAEVRFVDGDGRRMSLADFRGKVVLLNIWATWCGPCRQEMPTLDRLQARLGGPDFEVVALSIDGNGAGAVREFYAELGLKALRIYVDSSTMASVLLNALGIPATLLLDREGREVGRYTGPAEWDGEPAVAAIRGLLGPASASALTGSAAGG